jgi:hypothetical protein
MGERSNAKEDREKEQGKETAQRPETNGSLFGRDQFKTPRQARLSPGLRLEMRIWELMHFFRTTAWKLMVR